MIHLRTFPSKSRAKSYTRDTRKIQLSNPHVSIWLAKMVETNADYRGSPVTNGLGLKANFEHQFEFTVALLKAQGQWFIVFHFMISSPILHAFATSGTV